MKKICLLLVFVLLFSLLPSCGENEKDNPQDDIEQTANPNAGIILDCANLTMPIGAEMEIVATLIPRFESDDNALSFESANPQVATVSATGNVGKITAKAEGSTVITVTSEKVNLVRNLISEQSELLKQGIAITGGDYRYNIQYDYTSLNDIKPQMIEEATKNAREAAQKFAKDSESELGKIKRANQGQFSIENRDVNTPYIKRIRVVSTIDYSLED